MWDCLKCGCRMIAGSLGFCPQCYGTREEPASAPAPGSEPEPAAEEHAEEQ